MLCGFSRWLYLQVINYAFVTSRRWRLKIAWLKDANINILNALKSKLLVG